MHRYSLLLLITRLQLGRILLQVTHSFLQNFFFQTRQRTSALLSTTDEEHLGSFSIASASGPHLRAAPGAFVIGRSGTEGPDYVFLQDCGVYPAR